MHCFLLLPMLSKCTQDELRPLSTHLEEAADFLPQCLTSPTKHLTPPPAHQHDAGER